MIITALGAGAIFGAGLALAGMLNPAKVVRFFDVFGVWIHLWGWSWRAVF